MKTPIRISDTDAVARLTARIATLEKLQSTMKDANAIVHRKPKNQSTPEKVAELIALGIPDAAALFKPDFAGRIGFAAYELTNNNANIRRLREQLERAQEAQTAPAVERQAGGIRLEDCPSENRVKLFFPGKPDVEVRSRLKRYGFRWAPSVGAWQAYRNPSALGLAASFVPVEVALAEATGAAADREDDAAPAKLRASFNATHPAFQAEITAIATEGGKAVDYVFRLWRQYSDASFDQSALLSEFRESYAAKLGLQTADDRRRAEYQDRCAHVGAGLGLTGDDIDEVNRLAGLDADELTHPRHSFVPDGALVEIR